MVKELQKRFILVAMCAVTIVLIVIIGGINLVNYRRVCRNADMILTILAKNGGTFEGMSGDEICNIDGSHNDMFSAEVKYETRYFTVTVNGEGDVEKTNTVCIASVDDEAAVKYAANVMDKRKKSGFLDNYRYLKYETLGGTMVLFMDCSTGLAVSQAFLEASGLFVICALIAVFILLFLMSKRVMAPIIESYEKQKRFITDASHELKTPLTIISANNELMEMDHGESDTTRAITKQIQRMTKMTNNLTMLAKVDESQIADEKAVFDLSETAKDVVVPYEAMALSHGMALSYDIEGKIKLLGDEKLIRQMLSLMLDNCIKYGISTINFNMKKIKKNIYIELRNDAENIADGSLGKCFERFYRSDDTRASGIDGSGIGLSIVKEIVVLHKGKITAKGENGDFVINITL